jgi:hypothetical protein
MKMFGRAIAAFLLMVLAGYVAVVAFVPPPPPTDWRPADMTGVSAAARLSQEAQSLVSRRPSSSTLQ